MFWQFAGLEHSGVHSHDGTIYPGLDVPANVHFKKGVRSQGIEARVAC